MHWNVVLWQVLKFVVLLLLQVLLFNNMDFGGYISPYIYLIFFLDLPVNYKTAYAMLLGFLMGFCVDVFSNTMGVHTAACVLLCFVRSSWIHLLFSSLNAQQNQLTLSRVGWMDYLKYVGGLVLLHHSTLFLLESLSVEALGYTFVRIFLNTITSVSLILFYEYFRSK